MKDNTKLVATGRPHHRHTFPVNPPVERASTYIFPTYDDFIEGGKAITYGRLGTPTHRALEEAITALEGGFETRLTSSGLQACNIAILAFVEAGDHVLVVDSVYDPTRKFCENFLRRFGVETSYYSPSATAEELTALMRPETKLIFAESPGSLTFEVQDIPALAKIAHENGAVLVVDNTWSGGYYFKPISHGADASIQAATKYLCGHADCLLGSITSADEQIARKIFKCTLQLGVNVSADDAYLTLRGMRTLSARLKRHEENGLLLAKWLSKRGEVERILHPAFKACPGHALWKRDFTGSSGLFSAVLKPASKPAIKTFFNTLKLFGMGYSWGGFESLILEVHPEQHRSVVPWDEKGIAIRFHAGLEDIDDLTTDLNAAFTAMARAE